MRKVSERFPPRFLTAAGFIGSKTLTIKSVTEEKFTNGEALALWFEEINEGYVCRRRDNAQRLAMAFGDDPATWVGGQVTLMGETLSSGTKSIRVMVDGNFMAERRPPTLEEVAVEAAAPLDDLDDDLDGLFPAEEPAVQVTKRRKKA
jgi:hypothetical protein